MVVFNEKSLNNEIEYLLNVFHNTSGYPKAVIQNVTLKVKAKQSTLSAKFTESYQVDAFKVICLSPHVNGKFRNTTKEVNRMLPNEHKATSIYTFTKISSNFNVKDIKREHKHDLVYSAKCPEETCNETYNGETGRILVERIDKHMCINIE